MTKNNLARFLALFALPAGILLSAQAAECGDAVPPMISLLLRYVDDDCPEPKIVNWRGNEWQRCDDGNMYDWNQANTYCQDLTLKGHSDWRLPSKDELKSLVACSNGVLTPLKDPPNSPFFCGGITFSNNYVKPVIDSLFSCQSKFYWSSSVYYDTYRWGISFSSGYTDRDRFTNGHYVRCIR